MQLSEKQEQLKAALMANVEKGTAILVAKGDTTFEGVADEVSDEEVILAIKSVPTHY